MDIVTLNQGVSFFNHNTLLYSESDAMFRLFDIRKPFSGHGYRSPSVKRRSHAYRPQGDDLERRELLTMVDVSGKANIYGAGYSVLQNPPSPGGGGGGVLPTEVDLSTLGNAKVITFPNVTGIVSGWAAAGGYNGPDGGPKWGGVTNIRSYGGISGIYDSHATMFLVGVFLGANGQPTSAPARLDVSNANKVASFSPLIGQQFFIGDGSTDSHTVQTFNVPAGATRLFLGFAESWGFGHSNLYPGFYGDNGGSLKVNVLPIYNTSFFTDQQLRDTTWSEATIQSFLASHNSYFTSYFKDTDGSLVLLSHVIYTASQTYSINPKVLLATLQKESTGVTRTTRPNLVALMGNSAKTGAGQVMEAARLFDLYQRDLDSGKTTPSGWKMGQSKKTLDGFSVTPATNAIAGQFTYTPYVGAGWGGKNGGVALFYNVWTGFGF